MKIGIDISPLIYGTGVSVYTRNLIKNLLLVDNNNEYLFWAGSLRRLPEFERFTSTLQGNYKTKFHFLPPTLVDFIWNKLHLVSIETLIGKIDVFHSSDWTQPPSRAFRVTTVHDLVPFKYPQESHPRIISSHRSRFKWVKKEVDKIIAVSQTTKFDLVEMGIKESKIVVIPEAPERVYSEKQKNKVAALKQKLKIKDNYLLTVGVGGRKNSERIIEAFRKSNLKNTKLVFVGKAEKKLDAPDLIYTDFLSNSDYETIYYGAQALVYPPIYEGFGLPILEAFESGIPVVTSNLSSMPEVAGNAAVLVDPQSVDSIAKGIGVALANSDALIEKGRRQVKKFSWKATAEKTLEVYNLASTI